MPLITAELNAIADFEAARLNYASLHTADPTTTGGAEATGGTPAYARLPITPSTATAGVAAFAQVTFDVPAGTYTHGGVWTALTGGTFRGGNALSATQIVNGQDQIRVTVSIPVTATA